MYWERDHECMNRKELAQLQLERLQATLNRVARNVPFYSKQFQELGIEPDDFLHIEDLPKLPFTCKADLRDNYPYGLFAVPLREVVRVHSSSGATGKPTVVGYTRNDVKRWSNMTARILCAGGVTPEDVVQILFHYGLFTGGFGMHYGAERLGASVIPSSSGNAERQVRIMQDYRTTAIVGTPSYALHLADAMREMGLGMSSLCLKYGLFGAEAWSEAMRTEIQDRLGIVATDNYGLSEVMGPGVAGECQERKGLHVNEDHFLIEVIDPETTAPVPDGAIGELVVTTLTKEAFPVIRYRTGDLTRKLSGDCPCGRTFQRIDRIRGRSDDMITIKGVNVFPSEVEEALMQVEGAAPHYQIVLTREEHLDKATVMVEASEAFHFDQLGKNQELVARIKKRLSKALGVSFEVKLVEGKSLERSTGKAKRVIDNRTI